MKSINLRYHVLVLKTNVHKPTPFPITIQYEGTSFSCPRKRKRIYQSCHAFVVFSICCYKILKKLSFIITYLHMKSYLNYILKLVLCIPKMQFSIPFNRDTCQKIYFDNSLISFMLSAYMSCHENWKRPYRCQQLPCVRQMPG